MDTKEFKIVVTDIDYASLSITTLLSQHHQVTATDVIPEEVGMFNRKQSPIQDEYIEKFLFERELNLTAMLGGTKAYNDTDFVIVAAPTNYDPAKRYFGTHHIEGVIGLVLSVNSDAVLVIKSTIPIGYCRGFHMEYTHKEARKLNSPFSPELLRESMTLYDNLYPSRIIVGYPKLIDGEQFGEENEVIRAVADVPVLEGVVYTLATLLQEGTIKEGIPTLFMGIKEMGATKLPANTYFTLRVSYFSKLNTYTEMEGLDSQSVIQGVRLDPRTSTYYNNPSFDYDSCCLLKDTKRLLANCRDVSQNMMATIIESNHTRKNLIADQALHKTGCYAASCLWNAQEGQETTIGVHCLTMKSNPDNFRQSAAQEIMKHTKAKGVTIVIFEPAMQDGRTFFGSQVVSNLVKPKKISQAIIANRYDACLDDAKDKVYTRDIFQRD